MKKNKYILALFLITVIVFLSIFFNKYNIVNVRAVNANSNIKDNFSIKKIEEKSDTYDIKVYYPETKFSKVNDEINKRTAKYINEFNEQVNLLSNNNPSIKFNLEVTFDTYGYNEYVSYVFHVTSNIGGAHPNTHIFTINYNEKEDTIITMDDLLKKNSNIIHIISEYTYKQLSQNKKIIEFKDESMLKNGTSEKKENFENFALSNDGLIIFFERYSIAPYYLGEFKVVIPYETLKDIM